MNSVKLNAETKALVALVNGKRLERLEAQRCDLDLLPALFC